MKLLIDSALSPKVALALRTAGHDAVHVGELGLAAAEDPVILDRAAEEGRVLVSADADFGSLLAFGSRNAPSVILIRGQTRRRASDIAGILARLLPDLEADLEHGAAVSIRSERVRIRALPIRRATRHPD